MNTRSTRSTVTFSRAFTLSGYPDELPAGAYEVVVEEELIQGLSFEAYRRTASYLTVDEKGGRSTMRPVSQKELEWALNRDRAGTEETPVETNVGEAALSPPEDLK